MPHAREIIRDRIVAVVTGLETTGANVSDTRTSTFKNLPTLNVMTPNEFIRDDLGFMNNGNLQVRELNLVIQGRVKDVDGELDKIEDIVDEVVGAVFSDATIKSYAYDLYLDETSYEYSRDGSIPTGQVDILFKLLYQTDGSDPSNITN